MSFFKPLYSKILLSVLAFALVCGVALPPVQAATMPNLNLQSESAILIEATTGKILYKKNENVPLPPASMTKMMTEYLVLEAIEEGSLTWDSMVTTSPYAAWMGVYGGSRVYLVEGSQHTVRELYEGMAVASGNDATVALAEKIAGSETNFVQMMNEKAKEFGMENTHFRSSSGYPVEEIPEEHRPQVGGEHVMSARDAAILARRLVLDFPEALEISAQPEITFTEKKEETFPNWNWMVPGLIFEYEGVDGLKTGHTDAAGYCFTGTAKRGDIRLISVVMKASSENQRFHETRQLFDYGFSNFSFETLISKGKSVSGYETVSVVKGKEKEVSVVTGDDLQIFVKKGDKENYALSASLDTEWTNEDGSLVAPFQKGDPVGTVQPVYNGEGEWEYLTEDGKQREQVRLVAGETVEKAGWLRLFFRGIGGFIGGLFGGLANMIKGLFS